MKPVFFLVLVSYQQPQSQHPPPITATSPPITTLPQAAQHHRAQSSVKPAEQPNVAVFHPSRVQKSEGSVVTTRTISTITHTHTKKTTWSTTWCVRRLGKTSEASFPPSTSSPTSTQNDRRALTKAAGVRRRLVDSLQNYLLLHSRVFTVCWHFAVCLAPCKYCEGCNMFSTNSSPDTVVLPNLIMKPWSQPHPWSWDGTNQVPESAWSTVLLCL